MSTPSCRIVASMITKGVTGILQENLADDTLLVRIAL